MITGRTELLKALGVSRSNIGLGIALGVSVQENLMLSAMGVLSGGAPVPTVFDFTSSIPAGVTFTRAGARNYTNASNVQVSATNDVPCFDHATGGVSLGLSVQVAATNQLLRSNAFTTSPWATSAPVATQGYPAPDGTNNAWLLKPNGTGNQRIYQAITIVSGDRKTYITPKIKAETYSRVALVAGSTTTGMRLIGRIDGSPMYRTDAMGADFSSVTGGMISHGDGWYQFWISGTSAVTAGTCSLYVVNDSDATNFTGDGVGGIYVFDGAICKTGEGYAAPITTGAAAASTVADIVTITDLSWLDSTQGTFVMEVDTKVGVLLSSGANTIITSKSWNGQASKIAFTWDGTTSDLVANGEATTAGAPPTFDTTLSILSGANGRIKSLTYHPDHKSVSEIQALTTPDYAPTIGAWRTASLRNKLPNQTQALSGTLLNFVSRFKVVIGSGNLTKAKLDLSNFFAYTNTVGNSVEIDDMAFERVTGSATTPILYSAGRTVTLADGVVNSQSDELLPSAFGLSNFTRGDTYWVKIRGHVTTSGHKIPVGRSYAEVTGTQAMVYDPAVTNMSSTDTFGAYTWTGTAPTNINFGLSGILLGVYAAVDPATYFMLGASVTNGTADSDGGFPQEAMTDADGVSNPISSIECSLGGTTQTQWAGGTAWKNYLQFTRIGIDELGYNQVNSAFALTQNIWSSMRTAGIQGILRPAILLNTTSTDQWATEANQTEVNTASINAHNVFLGNAAIDGFVSSYSLMDSVRGTNNHKWAANGTPYYLTVDGGHPSAAGYTLLAADCRTLMAQVSLRAS